MQRSSAPSRRNSVSPSAGIATRGTDFATAAAASLGPTREGTEQQAGSHQPANEERGAIRTRSPTLDDEQPPATRHAGESAVVNQIPATAAGGISAAAGPTAATSHNTPPDTLDGVAATATASVADLPGLIAAALSTSLTPVITLLQKQQDELNTLNAAGRRTAEATEKAVPPEPVKLVSSASALIDKFIKQSTTKILRLSELQVKKDEVSAMSFDPDPSVKLPSNAPTEIAHKKPLVFKPPADKPELFKAQNERLSRAWRSYQIYQN